MQLCQREPPVWLGSCAPVGVAVGVWAVVGKDSVGAEADRCHSAQGRSDFSAGLPCPPPPFPTPSPSAPLTSARAMVSSHPLGMGARTFTIALVRSTPAAANHTSGGVSLR